MLILTCRVTKLLPLPPQRFEDQTTLPPVMTLLLPWKYLPQTESFLGPFSCRSDVIRLPCPHTEAGFEIRLRLISSMSRCLRLTPAGMGGRLLSRPRTIQSGQPLHLQFPQMAQFHTCQRDPGPLELSVHSPLTLSLIAEK